MMVLINFDQFIIIALVGHVLLAKKLENGSDQSAIKKVCMEKKGQYIIALISNFSKTEIKFATLG